MGAAVVIDERRLLTCADVVRTSDGVRLPLWVAFPKAEDAPRRRVTDVRPVGPQVADLAVLELDEAAPTGVAAAPLRCPRPESVVGRRWWAFGFADGDPIGDSAEGSVGASLTHGWVSLDTAPRCRAGPGFIGGGLWSPDYGAVVGVVGACNDHGDGHAITLYQAEELRGLAGWTLEADDQARDHWGPRARGVSVDEERGWRFKGRTAALSKIVAWLDRACPDRKVLVVTGSPGVGKSAVLGRVVTAADVGVAAALPADDDAVRATVGSVACAVHAKGKTAIDVAMEIARAASAPLAESLDDFGKGLHEALAERGGHGSTW